MVKIFLRLFWLLPVSVTAWAAPLDAPPPARSTVYLTESPAAIEAGRVDAAVVRRMVDAVVMAAAGRPDPSAAWRVWIEPTDRVGIKVSATGAPVASTHAAVVAAVAEGLVAAGVDARRIVIWDRRWEDMNRAGYGALARRFVVTATDHAGGYAEKETVTAAVLGRLIVGDREFDRGQRGEQTGSRSHLSRVLVEGVDKVVHVPALTDSVFSGLHGALAGMVLDNLDNWRRLARTPHHGDPYLPELYADPRIGGKVVLTIVDALRPQFAGGPFPGAQDQVNRGIILGSRDAVAADAVGAQLLEEMRRENGLPSLRPMTSWLQTAELLGLGAADPSRLRVVRLGAARREGDAP